LKRREGREEEAVIREKVNKESREGGEKKRRGGD
jgi:hypothetical protein